MRSAEIDSLPGIVELKESVNQAAGEAVTASDPIKDFKVLSVRRLVKAAPGPADRSPIIARGGLDGTQCGSNGLKIWIGSKSLRDHFFECGNVDGGDVVVQTLDFEPKASSEIFFIAKHH